MKESFKVILLVFLWLGFSNLQAQEKEGYNWGYNPNLVKSAKSKPIPVASKIQWNQTYQRKIYLLDTAKLPVMDDFTTNQFISYDTLDYPSAALQTKIAYNFKVNGIPEDTYEAVLTPTYSYYFNSATSATDSSLNTPVILTFYGNYADPFLQTSTQTAYPATVKNYYLPDGTLDTSFSILADTVYTLRADTILYINTKLGKDYLWLDHDVYVNDHFAIDPPSVYTATFDGLDSIGYPYQFTPASSYGVADYLTSKPIDLETGITNTDTSVVLSFFYEPQGYGKKPSPEDSLVLEFKSPLRNYWNWAWSVPGNVAVSNSTFQQVRIQISDSAFLENGFQFRFKSYATLSGGLDHWNVDFVYLDAGRSKSGIAINDRTISKVDRTVLKEYYVMPYRHFAASPSSYLKSSLTMVVKNLYSAKADPCNYSLQVFDNANVQQYTTTANYMFINPYIISTQTPTLGSYTFPFAGYTGYVDFGIRYSFKPNIFSFSENDTVLINQAFRNYYQRDDGSAEAAYYIDAPGKVAVKFNSPVADTLRAVIFDFIPQMFNASANPFKLKVWEDSSGFPGKELYSSQEYFYPVYNGINQGDIYPINSQVLINGNYFIGWMQEGSDPMNIGLDKNTDNKLYTLFSIEEGTWNSSLISGTPLIRPWVGAENSVGLKKNSINSQVACYPNPASSHLNFTNPINGKIEILSISGQVVLTAAGQSLTQIQLLDLANGVYFVKISHNSGVSTQKLVINR